MRSSCTSSDDSAVAHRVGLDGRVAHGQPADPARRRHVALQQPRSHGQDVGVVVEAVGEIVGRQHRPGIDLQVQQIADGVRVLQAVEAMNGRPAGIRLCGGGAVEGGLQPRRERVVGRGVRPRAARRGHRLRTQLLEDLLPNIGVYPDVLDVDGVEGEVPRQQALVVAGDAVAVEHRPPSRGVGRGWRLARSLLHNRRHGCGDRSGSPSCRGRGAQDERQESSDSWSRHGSRCRPGSPCPTRHRPLPRRRAGHPAPRHSDRRPGESSPGVSVTRPTNPLRKATPLHGADSWRTPLGHYRIGPSLKMSMKLSVVAALPSARSSSAVLPPPSPGNRM